MKKGRGWKWRRDEEMVGKNTRKKAEMKNR